MSDKEYQKQYRKKHHARLLEKQRKRREEKKEHIRQQQAEWRAKNPDYHKNYYRKLKGE